MNQRIVYHDDGTSSYFLDDKPVTQKEFFDPAYSYNPVKNVPNSKQQSGGAEALRKVSRRRNQPQPG